MKTTITIEVTDEGTRLNGQPLEAAPLREHETGVGGYSAISQSQKRIEAAARRVLMTLASEWNGAPQGFFPWFQGDPVEASAAMVELRQAVAAADD